MNRLKFFAGPGFNPVVIGVAGCFFLSGFAALLYQMAWMREFSTVFGTSEIAVATVLSSYMGGLAIGSAISGYFVRRIRAPILFYGLLEAAIAVSALLVPSLLFIASKAYVSMLGGQPVLPDASGLAQPLFYFVVAFVVLIIPTACMGATLPVLTKYVVTQDDQIGSRVGALYSINTFGAVCGALVAGFILLPELGLRGTVWFGVFINVLVFLMAVYAAKAFAAPEASTNSHQQPIVSDDNKENEARSKSDKKTSFDCLILPVMTLSGVCTFVYEVLWTRLLSHTLGGSVASFAIMLASFLSGIAIGSMVASRFAKTRSQALLAFVICQLGIAIFSVFIYWSLNKYLASNADYLSSVILAFLVLMPATLCIGATFPLAVRIYALNARVAASSSAKVYSWNTLGAIFGAALAGFFLIPLLKYEGAIRAMVLLNSLLALLVAARLYTHYRAPMFTSLAIFAFLLFLYNPELPENVLRSSPIDATAEGEILYYEVGRSSTVFMYEDRDYISLRNNGLPEAGAALLGSPYLFGNQRMLGAMPLLVRPDIESALIIGLGTGAAVTGVPPTVKEIDVIELEPKVIEANNLISERRKYQPLKDPRVSIVINDARSALALSEKKYDMIVSQPSHPWSAGASHLYTQEYMQIVSEHLNDDGVFLQWINTQFVDESLLKSLCATILSVYSNVRIYQWAPQVLFFVASDQAMDVEEQILSTGRPFRDAPTFYAQLGVSTLEDAVAALMMDESGVRKFASGSPVITDDFNMMAMESAQLVREGRELDVITLSEVLRPWVPMLNANHWINQELASQLNLRYIGNKYNRLAMRGYSNELIGVLAEEQESFALLLAGSALQAEGDYSKASEMLEVALQAMPDNNLVKYAIVQPWLGLLDREDMQSEIPEGVFLAAESLTGVGRTVVDAARALSQRNIQKIADLDSELAKATPSDPWYSESVKLRVDWRNFVTNPELKLELADQAWQIIDLATASNNDHHFLAMRIVSAAKSERVNETIQSTRGYIKSLDFDLSAVEKGDILPSYNELDAKLRQVRAIFSLVEGVASIEADRVEITEDIKMNLDSLIERLQVLMLELT